MSATLSVDKPASDIDDDARFDIEGYDVGADLAAEGEILAKGEKSFTVWFENQKFWDDAHREAALEAYLTGYLSMALRAGYEPTGGVA